jgi:hypothetical protein
MNHPLNLQIIGAWIDKIGLVLLGAYFVWVYPIQVRRRIKNGKITLEAGAASVKKMEFLGWGMISLGSAQCALYWLRLNTG